MDGHSLSRDEAGGRVETIEPAVGHLIRQLIQNDGRQDPAGDVGEIILDMEVDGVRYLAVRFTARSTLNFRHEEVPDPVDAAPRDVPTLSPRELEIARMVAKGYPNKSIAAVLDISSWTVSSHLRRIFSKLGVSSRAAMVAQLLEDRSSRESPGSPLPGRPLAGPSQERLRPSSRSK
jgi:DNA-binding CsgD family transcriptional regulator